MCYVVRTCEGERNWEFAFKRNGILKTINKGYQGKANLQIMLLDKVVFTDSKYTGSDLRTVVSPWPKQVLERKPPGRRKREDG
jgi:hypothetical protein